MKTIILILTAVFVLAACDQKSSTDSTKDRAAAEQEGANKVENDNLAKKAQKMESDLSDRHFFYGAIEGQYQGTVQVGNQPYNIKFNFVRSLPAYVGDRVRQLSEIENDLNNLYFYIQVVQWHADDPSSAVGCRVGQIRPDMQRGTMTIASADCPNLYTVLLSDLVRERISGVYEKAGNTANKIRQREIAQVEALVGSVQPTSNASTFNFAVSRIK